jgi:putative phosphoesterase
MAALYGFAQNPSVTSYKIRVRGRCLRKGMTLGVISDTHGLLRAEAVEALRGSDRILHAGDVGNPKILDTLAQIVPVTAIRGNVDVERWACALPEIEIVEVGGVSIYMLHDLSRLDLKPEAAGFRVVVYGHSHQPKIDERIDKRKTEEKNGVLYFNPGSAGPRRFNLPVSVGKLVIEAGKVRAELMELEV